MPEVTSTWYLLLAAALFMVGAVGLLVRRNPLVMLMCVELMLNAVNLTFVTFGTMLNDVGARPSCSSCWWWPPPRSLWAWASSWPSCAADRGPPPTTWWR